MKVLPILTSVCWFLLDQGFSDAGSDVVQSEIGESVTLNTGVKINQQDRMWWYFNEILLVRINGKHLICEDDQCKKKFGDRLKLDNQTGSLTITDPRTTDSGNYTLLDSNDNEKIYKVLVTDKKLSVKEGDPVTLVPSVTKNTKDSKTWRYNNTLTIAEITGDQSKICEDDGCKKKFGNRLKLDHQTGSLTIKNTRTNDSGEYNLEIGSGSRRHRRSTDTMTFVVNVSARTDSGASPGVVGTDSGASPGVGGVAVVVVVVVAVAVLLVASAAAGVIYYCKRSSRKRDMEENNQEPLRKTNSEKEEDNDQMT